MGFLLSSCFKCVVCDREEVFVWRVWQSGDNSGVVLRHFRRFQGLNSDSQACTAGQQVPLPVRLLVYLVLEF